MNKIKKHEIVIIIAVSILTVLPFINQAYYMDDFIYLNAATAYNEQGFDSFKGTSDQAGIIYPNYYFTHPLLWPWFLALFIKLFNTTNEAMLHIISIFCLFITGFSAILISKRFSKEPLIVTLFFLLLPAVMLLSHVMMTDIPTLAFFLLGIGLHIEGIEKKSKLFLVLAGFAATIACGISYQALFILFILIFYNLQRKEKRLTSYISVIIPSIFFMIWFLYTWKEFGIPHPLISFQWGDFADRNIFDGFMIKFIGNINSIGAATIFPAFVLIVYSLNSHYRKFLIASFIISILALLYYAPEYSNIQKFLFIVYFTTGNFILLRIILFLKNSLKANNRNNIFISFWFITFFMAILILMPMGITRYLLPCFLPAVIVIINDLKTSLQSNRFKRAISVGLIVTALWSISCSFAEYKFADTYRNFSEEFKSKFPDNNVWFCSDGLHWYMKKQGYKSLIYGGIRPKKGDFVVISSEQWPYYVPEVMNRTVLINKVSYKSVFPIRTMNEGANAGFYDNGEGLLPFSITRGGYEEFSVYKVKSN